MKKILALATDCEWFDADAYYSEEQACSDMIWIGGNRDFCEFNRDMREGVVKALEDCRYDLDAIDDELSDEEQNAERLSTIKYYFDPIKTVELTEDQYFELGSRAIKWYDVGSRDENEFICEVLGIIHGKEFEEGTLRGCSQGDWVECIYPAQAGDFMHYIGAVYFGTGTEFRIAEVDLEDREYEADELVGLIDDSDDCCHDYTDLWEDDGVREWIAKNASYGNNVFSKDDVIIIDTSYKMVKQYSYSIR